MSTKSRLTARALTCVLPDGRTLFSDLSFSLATDCLGLVGPNGSGKSTLLAMLAGQFVATSGSVRADAPVAYVPQSAAPAGTVAEALGTAVHRLARLPPSFDLAHLAPERALSSLSGGEVARVRLAGALLSDADVLLLDEPSNHLDAPAREALFAMIRERAGAVIVASHDRALLRAVDRMLELSPAGHRWFGGGWSEFARVRAAEQAAAARQFAHAERERARERRTIQQAQERRAQRHRASATRADRRGASAIERGGARERASGSARRQALAAERRRQAVEEEVESARRQLAARTTVGFSIPARARAPHHTLVQLHSAGVQFGSVAALAATSCVIHGRTRLAVTGANGSGKSTLLRLLAGDIAPSAGLVARDVPKSQIALLPQQLLLVDDRATAASVVADAHPSLDRTTQRAWLAAFGFRSARGDSALRALSGGERLRLALAAAISPQEPPALLLLDEPGNHLDLDALDVLEQALRDFSGALVIVSHDAALLDAIGITERLVLPAR